jgi:hypothetical protein
MGQMAEVYFSVEEITRGEGIPEKIELSVHFCRKREVQFMANPTSCPMTCGWKLQNSPWNSRKKRERRVDRGEKDA